MHREMVQLEMVFIIYATKSINPDILYVCNVESILSAAHIHKPTQTKTHAKYTKYRSVTIAPEGQC